jgi:predicted nucleotidyltransferase
MLFGGYRRRVLGLLLLQPEAAYHVREIARLTGTSAGTLHKELTKLADAGILSRERRGNQVAYRANQASPIFGELASIMRKTSGLADVLVRSLGPCADQILVAFVFGSVARGAEVAASDIDILLIGSANFRTVVNVLYPAQTTLGREINPKIFSAAEWKSHVRRNEPFVVDVLAKPKIFLIGDERDLGELVGTEPGGDHAES